MTTMMMRIVRRCGPAPHCDYAPQHVQSVEYPSTPDESAETDTSEDEFVTQNRDRIMAWLMREETREHRRKHSERSASGESDENALVDDDEIAQYAHFEVDSASESM